MFERDLNPDLCGASAMLHQLSYQANWKLVIMWIDANFSGLNRFYISSVNNFEDHTLKIRS